MQLKLHALTLALLFVAAACPGNSEGTDSDSDPTPTTSSTTDAEMSTTDADTGTTTTGQDGNTSTEGDTIPEDPTIGDPLDQQIFEACQAVCEREIECGTASDPKTCAVGCALEFGTQETECDPMSRDFLVCLSQSSCLELEGPIDEGPCAELYEMVLVCTNTGPVACEQTVSEGEECGVKTECPGESTQELVCDAETCTCFDDGQEVTSCPADGVCQQGDGIFDKVADCCGWVPASER
jgi:hypothetical protein